MQDAEWHKIEKSNSVETAKSTATALFPPISPSEKETYFGTKARAVFFDFYKDISRHRHVLEGELNELRKISKEEEEEKKLDLEEMVAEERQKREDGGRHQEGSRLQRHSQSPPKSSYHAGRKRRVHSGMLITAPDEAEGNDELRKAAATERQPSPLEGADETAPPAPDTIPPSEYEYDEKLLRQQPEGSRTHRTLKRDERQKAKDRWLIKEADEAMKKVHLGLPQESAGQFRPLSARTRFLLGCVTDDIAPRPSLLIRKNVSETLDLSRQYMGDNLASLLSKSFSSVPCLRVLNICENNLTDAGIASIITTISLCPQLSSLNLSANKIGTVGLDALAKYIRNENCALTTLIFRSAQLDDTFLRRLVDVSFDNICILVHCNRIC